MLSRHIVNAQKVLRKLEGTPIIVKPDNSVQVTYDSETYKMLLEVIVACSEERVEVEESRPLERPVMPSYHRERV